MAGHLAGCEAVVHAMHQVFQSPSTEAVILVDACNVFNSFNRETALRNIPHLWQKFLLTPTKMMSEAYEPPW